MNLVDVYYKNMILIYMTYYIASVKSRNQTLWLTYNKQEPFLTIHRELAYRFLSSEIDLSKWSGDTWYPLELDSLQIYKVVDEQE